MSLHSQYGKAEKKNTKSANEDRMIEYLREADIVLHTGGSSKLFGTSKDQLVYGVGGVILLPKRREGRGIWGGCFRQFCGSLGNIDNAEFKATEVGLEIVLEMLESGVLAGCSEPKVYIRSNNEKLVSYLTNRAREGDRNYDDCTKTMMKRVQYLLGRLRAIGAVMDYGQIERESNRFVDQLANDGAIMQVRDDSKENPILGNLTRWSESEVPVRLGLGARWEEDFPTGLDLEVKFPM